MPITDRYGTALKQPEQKPSVQQSLDSWALLNELLGLGYPHNFQHEAAHISGYLYDISALIDKAYKIKREVSDDWDAPTVNRWIPCSERMPEVGIPVLIYDKHHKAFFVAKLDEDYFGFSSNMWHHPADVPFWMPLPDAPREDRENA